MTSASGRELGRLAGHSASYAAAAVLTKGAAFLLLPVYTRFLGLEGYGIVALAGVVTSALGVLLPLSLHAAVARVYHDAPDESARRDAVGTVWLAVALLALVVSATLDVLGERVFDHLLRSVPFHPYLRLALWTACFTAIGLVPLQLLQTLQRARTYSLVSAGGILVTNLLVVWFVVLRGEGAAGFLRGTMIGAAVTAGAAALVVRSQLRLAWRRPVLRGALLFSLPLVPHTLGGWVIELSDRAVLERFVAVGDVGLYAVGYQIGMLMSIVASSMNGALAPHLYAVDAASGPAAAATGMARIATYYCLVLGAVAVVLSVLAVDIVRVLAAPSFRWAYEIARPVILGQLAAGVYYLPVNVLFIRGRTGVVPLVTAIAAALNLALNLALVPRYGVHAAAWSTAAAFLATLVLTALAARRVQRIPYERRRLAAIAIAVLGTMGAGWAAADVAGARGVALRLAVLGLLPLILWLGGFVTPVEHAALRTALARVRVGARRLAPRRGTR